MALTPESLITGVCLTSGAAAHGFDPRARPGVNVTAQPPRADVLVSLDSAQRMMPALAWVRLVPTSQTPRDGICRLVDDLRRRRLKAYVASADDELVIALAMGPGVDAIAAASPLMAKEMLPRAQVEGIDFRAIDAFVPLTALPDLLASTPPSLPLWVTFGCPAVDHGDEEPAARFPETPLPRNGLGFESVETQRAYLTAALTFWATNAARSFVWCWDARPFPQFPARADLWPDTIAYRFGHHLNGRLRLREYP